MSQLFKILTFLIVFGAGAIVHGQGIVFKIPDGVLPMDWNKSGFKGFLMLQKESPSGIFISSPNDGETIDQLRERAAKFIAPMVVDVKDKAVIPFDIKSIAKHDGDFGEDGKYYFYRAEKSSVQILFYQRKTNGSVFLYGYFASKGNEDKKSSIWTGDDGKNKLLEKFIKSFGN